MTDERDFIDLLSGAVSASTRPAVEEFVRRPVIGNELSCMLSRTDAADQSQRVLDMISRRISDAPPDHEQQVVQSVLLAVLQQQLDQELLKLAIRRFLSDHPEKLAQARPWLEALDIDKDQADGSVSDRELAEVEARVHELENCGAHSLQATMMANAARSGTFDATSGALADFLIDVGYPTNTLDVE